MHKKSCRHYLNYAMHHIPFRHTSGLIRTRSRVWAVWLPRPRGPGLHTETAPMRLQAAVAVPPDHHKCQESRTYHCLHDIVNLPAAHHRKKKFSLTLPPCPACENTLGFITAALDGGPMTRDRLVSPLLRPSFLSDFFRYIIIRGGAFL